MSQGKVAFTIFALVLGGALPALAQGTESGNAIGRSGAPVSTPQSNGMSRTINPGLGAPARPYLLNRDRTYPGQPQVPRVRTPGRGQIVGPPIGAGIGSPEMPHDSGGPK